MKNSSLHAPKLAPSLDESVRCVHVTSYDRQQPIAQRVAVITEARRHLDNGEVRVGMLAMTINPADLLQMNGGYGVQPKLPYTPGHEGVGIVLEAAPDVTHVSVGDLVLPLAPGGTWRDERVLSARQVTVVEGEVDILQCAMLSANPVTAWVLLHGLAELTSQNCLIQNAANSAVGQCVRQLAAAMGVRLINVVRRADAIDNQRLGDEHWIIDQDLSGTEFAEQVRRLAGGKPIPLALDAIAGQATSKLAASVSPGGKVVVYGLLSQQPSQVEPADLVFRGVSTHGFWLASWFADAQNRATAKTVTPSLLGLLARGDLQMSVAATYDLAAIGTALDHADQPRRDGKVLLTGAWLARLQQS
ncbi:MAG: zinc-dependent alcohol dehydrogenase family protein [Betaproteobacteria bacterium]|nr:zinc-dependent alcohol dehydrogenase family protein [Betaproteobacteria bacterium]